MAEWRECEFGTDTPEGPFDCRQCFLNVRRIVYGNMPDGIYATRNRTDCASCPVPALKAKADLCDELAAAIRTAECTSMGCIRNCMDEGLDEGACPIPIALLKYDALEASRG